MNETPNVTETEVKPDPLVATPESTPVNPELTATPETPPVGSNIPAKGAKAKYINLAVEAVLLLALIALGAQYANLKTDNVKLNEQIVALQNNPLLVAEKKTNDTIQAVSRLTTVPQNDTPTVSEVTDSESVKKSIVGLTDVQNGDKLLFYFKGGKFIQYRPSTDKIILNQPLNVK